MPSWAYGVIVTIGLALLGYLVRGLLTWGRVMAATEGKLSELTEKANKTSLTVEKIQAEMLRPADLRAAVLEMQVQFYRESINAKQETK